MEAFASPKEAIDEILKKIQTIFGEQSSGESKIEVLLKEIADQIREDNVKAQVILKQQLGHVLTEMENNMVIGPSNNTSKVSFFKSNTSSSNVTQTKSPLDDARKKKVMEGLESVAQKAKYLKGRRMELVAESEEGLKLVGREKEKEDIIDQLMLLSRSGDGASPVPVITIAGLAGIGKTILARHICQDEKVKQHVGLPAWVIGTNCNTFDANSIVKQVIATTTSSPNRIVILDDWRVEIGDKDVKALQDKLLEKKGLCVTAMVITTRSCLVARNIAASPFKSYALAGLNEEESLSLFQMILGRDAADHSTFTEQVRRCRGVPLAIITTAKWLQSPRSIEFKEELMYSYYDEGLPHSCFAYCSLFPQDYLFDAERLIHLWMAEGFLKPSNPSTSSASEPEEEIGRRYLRDLVGRSIFQDVVEDEFGQVRRCKMHPLMHDIATFVADRENITLYPNGNQVHPKVLRASFYMDSLGIPKLVSDKAKQLRSILLFGKNIQLHSSVLEKIFESFKRLCVLDLRDLGIEEVPSSIGELKDLEHLDLSQNEMEKLPSSIAKLSKLHTLKLFGCRLLKELPKDFKNVAQLKHLDMEGCLGLTGMPREMSKLSSLQTLSAFVVSKNDPMGSLDELAKLSKLRGNLEILHLDRVLQSLENTKTKYYLEKKQDLQRLTLRWDLKADKEEGKSVKRHLELLDRLKPHSALGALILAGYRGGSLSSWLTSIQFTRLVKLRLQDCPRCKSLSQQDQLPKLKILELVRLENLECIAENCNKEAAFYKALEELTIEDCPKLKSWWQTGREVNDRPFFARISKLHVHNCPELMCMPLYPRLDKELVLEGSSSFGKVLVLEDSSLKLLLDTRSMSVNSSIPLEDLHIQYCNDLENLPNGFHHLSSLQCLRIENCAKLNLYGPNNQWQGLKSLRFLTLREIPNLRSLPFGNSVTTLRELTLHSCHGLTSISDSIGKLTSLRELTLENCRGLTSISDSIDKAISLRSLVISHCIKLKSLPKSMKELKSLHTLRILDCALLLPRCQPETGDDWPQIRHIKHREVK